jgi:hypothetical protein
VNYYPIIIAYLLIIDGITYIDTIKKISMVNIVLISFTFSAMNGLMSKLNGATTIRAISIS